MSDMKLLPVIKNPSRNTNDSQTYIGWRGNRTGVGYVADYFEDLAAQGRIYTANMGSVTTPLTFVVTADKRPDAWIRVPTGTTILPIKVNVILEGATGTATEIDIRACQNDIGNGTSSAASVGPYSNRTDFGSSGSNCTARQLATGDVTAETNPISLYRRTYARADEAGIDWRGVEAVRAIMGYPILVGPASLEVFVAATTNQATGFVIITWGEVPSGDYA